MIVIHSKAVLAEFTITKHTAVVPNNNHNFVQFVLMCLFSQQTRDVDPPLVHRLRRWPNIKPTLNQRLIFD